MRFLSHIFVMIIAVLVMTEGFWWHRKSKKRKKNRPDEAVPPVFDDSPMPVHSSYDICVSDFLKRADMPGLIQIHYTVTHNGEIVRGFCTKDLIPFEQKVRAEIRMLFERLEDNQTDRTIKIWYINPDDRKFDTNDIPLQIAITFYQPANMDKEAQTLLKEQITGILRELLTIDWKEVNGILQTCCTSEHRLADTLNKISKPDYINETEMQLSTERVLKCLCRDMSFFYENQSFFGYGSVLANLEAKYTELDTCYLQRLAEDYCRDTLF